MKYFAVLAKIVFSVALLAVLAPRINTGAIFELLMEPATLIAILFAVLILMFQSLLAAFRQVKLFELFGEKLTIGRSLQVWFSGLFVSQALVTFIAGDVVRVIQVAKTGIPRRIAARGIVLDRVIGLVCLLAMVVAVTPFIVSRVGDPVLRFSLLVLCALSVAGIFAFLAGGLLDRIVALLPWQVLRHRVMEVLVDLMSVARFLVQAPSRSLEIFLASILMHLLNILAIVAIAYMIGVTASLLAMSAIMVPVMLLTMLPVSFAGWGVREAASVTGLGLLGVQPEIALTISVIFGASMLLASLPGFSMFLAHGAKQLSSSTLPVDERPQ